jgi:3-dehydroquinate synthase
MRVITVKLPAGPANDYTIHVGVGALQKIGALYDLERYSKVFVISDEALQPLLAQLIAALPASTSSVLVPSGERHKHIETVQKLWKALHTAGCDRQSLVINLGGGGVGDLGGFAASTYMRGLPFLNVPTTLLAQADASVGGKTGCNFDGVKNLVGTFDQPLGVVVDPALLASLPPREFTAGFGEIIKHGLIRDKAHFEHATAKPPLEFTQTELTAIIVHSCALKAELVQADPTESAERKLLNFGHTVGHAVEALSLETDQPLLHGEAVSIGMVIEADIARRAGLLPAADFERAKQALTAAGLPTALPDLAIADLLTKMRSDKKNAAGQVNFTLLRGIGRAVYDQRIDDTIVRRALQAAREEI